MRQAAINAFRLPDVRRKLLFTFGMLIVYRIAAAIPVPSFDSEFVNQRGVVSSQCWPCAEDGRRLQATRIAPTYGRRTR
jgi:hypothetical protein